MKKHQWSVMVTDAGDAKKDGMKLYIPTGYCVLYS